MDHYLDMLFGDHEGYVALAAKGETWEEQQFSWPSGRERLVRWVERRIDSANIFVCPSLRSEKRRVKDDGVHLRWLWADIDWDKVPEDKRVKVQAALEKLKPARVLSGTGDNLHVYLRLTREVDLDEHYRLNQGLRDLLFADAKHPDNSLLRLPGTYNRKARPVEVTWESDSSKSWKPEDLLRIPAIRDTVVTHKTTAGDGTYDRVDLSGCPAYARRIGRMSTDEATDRYGTRHGAVYQVTQKLIKLGLNRNEIHTAMEEFAPGLEKEEDERGYDMHRDIDKCIGAHPTLDRVIDDEDDDIFQPLTEEEAAEEDDKDLNQEALKQLRRWDINDRAKQLQAHRTFLPPPDESSELYGDVRDLETETRYLIDGLASVGDNITITGQYKSGKTLFVCNLVRCLADGEMFLDNFEIDELLHRSITVGFWSCEMTRNVLLNRYLEPQSFNPDGKSRLHLWHGRGYGIDLMTDIGRRWTIDWLQRRDVSVWVIDSFARVCSMSGVDPNDNDQVLKLLRAIDEIKRAAGVSELFLIAHTGRGELTKDRARGATVFDDWADARWVLTREGDVRFLKVEGRDVDLAMTSLKYDGETKRLSLGTDRSTTLTDMGVQSVVVVVAENPGINKTALVAKLKEKRVPGYSQPTEIAALIDEAVDLGFIRKDKVPGARGGRMEFSVVADADEGEVGPVTLDFGSIKDDMEKGRGRRRRSRA